MRCLNVREVDTTRGQSFGGYRFLLPSEASLSSPSKQQRAREARKRAQFLVAAFPFLFASYTWHAPVLSVFTFRLLFFLLPLFSILSKFVLDLHVTNMYLFPGYSYCFYLKNAFCHVKFKFLYSQILSQLFHAFMHCLEIISHIYTK